MKAVFSIILYLLLSFHINAQDNVFILVDVSKSVSQQELINAKQLVKEVLSGNYSNSSFFSNNGQVPKYSFNNGSHLIIIHFGDKGTVMNNTPIVNSINSCSELVTLVEQHFRTNPTDNRTYLTLAKAKCADEAYKNSIKEYSIVLVSDNVSDDFGGSITGYSHEEQNLVNRLNTITNTFAGSLFTYSNRAAFTVLFQKINLNGYGGSNDSDGDGVPDLIDNCPGTPKGQIVNQFGCPDTILQSLKIELTSFKGGTSKKPIGIKSDKITVSWFCRNAPRNAQYKIRLSPVNNPGEKSQNFTSTGNSYNLQNISDGIWKITVSSGNPKFNASPANTTIEVNASGSSWFLWLLLFSVLFGCGYWYWKKTQEDKLQRLNSVSTKDNFSTGSTLNTNSDNSGYF
jgi:hypothetical protein